MAADRLRFDFTHSQPVSDDELQKIETLVNEQITAANSVETEVMSLDQAKAAGAIALFGEKYTEKVRVLTMGEFSKELCGGTHVANTAMIRAFKIVGETGVAAGIRRIEAITADRSIDYLLKNTKENV